MLSSRTSRRFALFGLLALGGCGFAPLYGDGGTLRNAVAYDTDDSVAGFHLRQQLQNRLGNSSAPRYGLRVTQRSRSRAAAITDEGDTTRLNIVGSASWVLTDLTTGAQIEAGEVEAFTSYAATGSTVATQTTRDDAERRLSIILADMIAARLLALSPDLAQ